MTMRPPSSIPELVGNQACRLGVGPFWQPASGLLYWTDAYESALYSYDPAASKAAKVATGEKVLQGVPRADGSVLLLMADGMLKVLEGGVLRPLETRLSWSPGAQLDAVTVDRQGRLLYAARSAAARSANLYRVSAGGTEEVLTGLGRPSGLGFDPGGGFLYCSNAASREIMRFACDSEPARLPAGRQSFRCRSPWASHTVLPLTRKASSGLQSGAEAACCGCLLPVRKTSGRTSPRSSSAGLHSAGKTCGTCMSSLPERMIEKQTGLAQGPCIGCTRGPRAPRHRSSRRRFPTSLRISLPRLPQGEALLHREAVHHLTLRPVAAMMRPLLFRLG